MPLQLAEQVSPAGRHRLQPAAEYGTVLKAQPRLMYAIATAREQSAGRHGHTEVLSGTELS